MELLRMGESPEAVCHALNEVHYAVNHIKEWQPSHDMADLYRAYKDADFRP